MMVNSGSFMHLLHILLYVCWANAYAKLSDESLKAIPDPGDDFNIKTGKFLAPILQTRVPGTPGSTAVLNHFADFFRDELPAWKLSFQNSTSTTPVTGSKEFPFINMIATRDPPWISPGEVGYLTLVAHYDSLMNPKGFIGAIDSAAPCAFLMHAARSLEPALVKKWASMGGLGMKTEDFDGTFEQHKGVQVIFLDGEEAFGQWSDQDSIYGARSLAEEMESTLHPAMSTYHNAMSSISLFLLLDLLGSPAPIVPSYFKTTHWAYKNMATIADRLDAISRSASASVSKWFPDYKKSDMSGSRWLGGMVLDDHLPFMARGVEVLHMIPTPFPDVWHNMDDDGEHLDLDVCRDWAVLVTAFAAEWMELDGFFESDAKGKRGLEGSAAVTSKTEL